MFVVVDCETQIRFVDESFKRVFATHVDSRLLEVDSYRFLLFLLVFGTFFFLMAMTGDAVGAVELAHGYADKAVVAD